MKYTKDEVIERIKEKGFEPLEFDWNGYKSMINFKDKDGYKYSISWSRFNRDDMVEFKPIYNINPYYFENMKNYLIVNHIGCKILSNKPPKNITSKLLFRGECGHTYEKSWSKFINRKSYACPKCSYDNVIRVDHVTKDYLINLYEEHDLTILDSLDNIDKIGNRTPLIVRDKDGYLGQICYGNLQQRDMTRFEPFSKWNPYTINNIKHYIDVNKLEVELVSTKYEASEKALKFKCSCGSIFEATIAQMRNSKYFTCSKCRPTQSNLERDVEMYLKDNNINYTPQKKFKGCQYKGLLRFDFYTIDYNICIEVQGEQHYFPIDFGGGEENALLDFKENVIRDNIKKKYCEENNITLICLKYDIIRNGKFKTILNDIF